MSLSGRYDTQNTWSIMTRRKPGSKPKDSAITDNPNLEGKKLSKREIAALKTKEARLSAELTGGAGDSRGSGKKPPKKTEDPITAEEKDLKIAQKMLEDLRYAYRNAVGKDGKKGRERLMELMKTDFEFKFAMKELMKIESALVSSKIKSRENAGGNGESVATLVILKGLYDEEPKKVKQDERVDLDQVANALNPEYHEQEPKNEDAVEGPGR